MKSPLRGADLLARSLATAGARHLFALSGNHVMPVFDAALDAGLEIIHVRHEAAAVHMLDHIGFSTRDLARARAFYEKALKPLGITVIMTAALKPPRSWCGRWSRQASRGAR